ncbi:hypothetical protein LAZ67_16001117 [Cordylochernes scorpioides]|uniref:Uncharacterized protein n=1 Tax=Cordylochernes scorpioides TaxID=51811 RepID=A0ABY6LEN7_9ARAC|nr:hypothetical protein LAZ67_16001117 [Cordylochernes scorpioides]
MLLVSPKAAADKTGKCPPVPESTLPAEVCNNTPSECSSDISCGDDLKCCSNGCNSVCTTPVFSGCEQVRSILKSQEEIFVPSCTSTGEFEPVQCHNGSCWCVDELGFEEAGTRAVSRDLVNCSDKDANLDNHQPMCVAPRDCAGFLCRMLCPYGFALDEEGCPICHCRNPCENFQCPDGKECQLEDLPCGDEICPPLPTFLSMSGYFGIKVAAILKVSVNSDRFPWHPPMPSSNPPPCVPGKQPRLLAELCPAGSPLASPETGHPFLCGTEPSKPQCPASFLCEVQPGNDYGVCCPLLGKSKYTQDNIPPD